MTVFKMSLKCLSVICEQPWNVKPVLIVSVSDYETMKMLTVLSEYENVNTVWLWNVNSLVWYYEKLTVLSD